MKLIKNIRELIWPVIEPSSREQKNKNEKRLNEYGNLESLNNKTSHVKDEDYVNSILMFSQNCFNEERERLKTIETKSITLLSASGLIITLLMNFLDQTFKALAESALFGVILIFTIFVLSLIYFLKCILLSIKVLEKNTYHQLDAKTKMVKNVFIKEAALLYCSFAIKNEIVINEKVDYMVMAQEYFKRGIITSIITGILYIAIRIVNIKNKEYEMLFIGSYFPYFVGIFIVLDIILNIANILSLKKDKIKKQN